jgi:hypothetical protein
MYKLVFHRGVQFPLTQSNQEIQKPELIALKIVTVLLTFEKFLLRPLTYIMTLFKKLVFSNWVFQEINIMATFQIPAFWYV